jgi:hypothetical protein
MASQIPTFYVSQFSSNIALKLQQEGSVLRSCVMNGTHVGSQASPVDQFGAVVGNKVVGRYNPMTRVDAPTDRRWVFPQDYDLPQLLDSFDQLRMLIDPMSSYVTNATFALGRNMDDEILAGLLNANFTGNSGTTSTTLGSGQVVGVNQGAASATNMTVAKLREGRRILMANNLNMDREELYIALNATNIDSLLAETQVISSEFNDQKVLVNGKLTKFLGVNIVHTELLTTGTDDQSGTSTACPMWAKSGAYLGIWGDIMSSIDRRTDLQGIPLQAYVKGTFGATRLEEKKVVKIWAR